VQFYLSGGVALFLVNNMETKICLVCGKEFKKNVDYSYKTWGSIKYCSRKCMGIAMKTRVEIKCDYCGKKYEETLSKIKINKDNNWKNYCSDECKWKARQIGSGLTTDGYVWIIISNNRKQIKLHRYLMEIKLRRKISLDEIVHHKDHNKLNNDINNLEIVTRSEHNKIHRFLKGHS